MRFCEECLNKYIKSMENNTLPDILWHFTLKNPYYRDNTICDICGQKLSKKMLEQWELGEKMYENDFNGK